jgi:hypothetical protein
MTLLAGIVACAGKTGGGPQPHPFPTPVESPGGTVSREAPPGGWSFQYSVGTSNYRTTRNAAIEAQTDSGPHREISTNTTYESISLNRTATTPDTSLITVVADSFATTTQGRIGPVQPVQLPMRISATISGNGVSVEGQTPSGQCDPVASTLASDLRNLIPTLPAQLTPGMSWSDSIQTGGCQAGIPTTLDLRRVFLVSGETRAQNQSLLVVLRTDTIAARGEGSQLQHRVALQAEGTGRATYYLDPATGKVVQLTTEQDLNLSFSASARTTRFRETSRQEFLLLR